jgi:hypothetical protein
MKVDEFWINLWVFMAIVVFLMSFFSFALWSSNNRLQSEEYKDYTAPEKKIFNDITILLLDQSKVMIPLGIAILSITYLIFRNKEKRI